MINFYPGPSKIYPQVAEYTSRGIETGILSMNHRSPEFMDLLSRTTSLLKEKLQIPENYEVVFTSSATECWEIIAQSLIEKKSSHIYNGAFGEKWMDYTSKLGKQVQPIPFGLDEELSTEIEESCEVICITQNETSNGTQLPCNEIQKIRESNTNQLLAIDATSSMAGAYLNFGLADIWFASVQKCFGLPAGQAVMVLSPKAIEVARRINENQHYNSLTFLLDNAIKNQTAYTPNILGILLLNQLLSDLENIESIAERIGNRCSELYSVLDKTNHLSPLSEYQPYLSKTVVAIKPESNLGGIMNAARESGLLLGQGYGAWKESSFRIANFPAITDNEWGTLLQFLSKLSY